MNTVAYVAVMTVAFASNITATVLTEKFKRKGLIN